MNPKIRANVGSTLLCVFLSALTGSCALGYVVKYRFQGNLVRTPQRNDAVYSPRVDNGEYFVRFEDELGIFDWRIDDDTIRSRIRNNTDGPLLVSFDRAEYVDPEGKTHKLVPPPSRGNPSHRIESGDTHVYTLYLAEPRRAIFDGPSPGLVFENPEEIQDLYRSHVGKSFQIRVPVRTGSLVYQYEFQFKVSSVEPRLARQELF